MFKIGDKIFYPAHGGGIVENIEEKQAFGVSQLYYSINIPNKNMQIMIPTGKSEQLGVRPVVDLQTLEDVFATFFNGEIDPADNDNQRDRKNLLKIKSGNIYEGAEVIRDLLRINSKKKLGTTQKNMLDNARQILISEVVLVKDINPKQASDLLDQIISPNS